MKIIVCIKQVPDAKDIQWTANNTMKREGVEGVINSCDLYALQAALSIKKNVPNVQVTAVSMGPMQAENILKQAIALGADNAYLICDKKFSGSDTLATGLTLSSAIKKIAPDFSLVLCGQYASDGDTAQTGVEIAENLNTNQVTYTLNIEEINDDKITVLQDCEDYVQKIKLSLPAVVCLMENKNVKLSDAPISGQMRAQDYKVKVLTKEDLNLSDDAVGIKGSPTYVSNVFRPIHSRKSEVVENEKAIDFVKSLVSDILGDK